MCQQNEYDHAKKIGNQGDLIKHFALTVAVKKMASGRDSFSYLDVHSGRRIYALPDGGKWEQGIGKFAERCRDENPLPKYIRYFCDIQSIGNIHDTREYWGSSKIVSNVLDDLGIGQKLILCDKNPSVCCDLVVHDLGVKALICDSGPVAQGALEDQAQSALSVEVHCADGYQKAREADKADLVFIDPPNISDHYDPFMRLVRHCVDEGKNFISWNPLHGNINRKTMSANCRRVAEFAERNKIPHITVRWKSGWTGQICGCQMLFSIPQGKEVSNACKKLIELMRWHDETENN